MSLGAAFFGESMFARAPDASKIAFVASVRQLDAWRIGLIDCQVHTEHLERFGAYEVPRLEYLQMLARALDEPTRRGEWTFEIDLDAFAKTGGVHFAGVTVFLLPLSATVRLLALVADAVPVAARSRRCSIVVERDRVLVAAEHHATSCRRP